MNFILANTFRFAQTLGVVSTLLAMLFVSSAQGAWEECSEETVTQEIELLVGRRQERRVEENDLVSVFQTPVAQQRPHSNPIQYRSFVVKTERENMNGSGTNLLI